MNEQRQEKRKKLMAFTPVYDASHRTLLGYVGDLTMKGVLVVGEKPLEVNKQMTISIETSEEIAELNEGKFSIPARVAWCRPDPESSQYTNIGLEFTEVSPQNKVIIDAILERYHFRHSSIIT